MIMNYINPDDPGAVILRFRKAVVLNLKVSSATEHPKKEKKASKD